MTGAARRRLGRPSRRRMAVAAGLLLGLAAALISTHAELAHPRISHLLLD